MLVHAPAFVVYKTIFLIKIFIIRNRMFKPLLRTMPSLNGNIKLSCYINDYDEIENNVFEGNVRYATLSPLSSQLYNKYLNVSLLSSSYEWDVREFYKKYSDYFYKKMFEVNKNDLPMYQEYGINKNRNTDFEFGVKRISFMKSGKQFSFFAPIFIETINDVPDYFEITINIKNNIFETTRTIRINLNYNLANQKNYIGRYILDYANKIDNNVIYLSPDNSKAIYYGIDVITGGFSTKHDVVISSIFNKQNTLLNFDSKLNSGFERNKMIMKQILPLSFNFSLNDVLNNIEKETLLGAELSISGKWIKNEKEVSLYDFSHNYVEYNPTIYELNMIDGHLKPIVPKVLNNEGELSKVNVMNIGYPGLRESLFYKYRYSNKFTPNFNRWKLRYSDDKNPYIINLSPSFSLYQKSRTKYHQFPSNYEHIPGVVTKKPYYLNLVFPLNSGEEKYNTTIADKYYKIRNNYCSNWFEVFDKFSTIKDYFVDVDSNKAFFNGVLYNLQNIYDGTNKKLQKIDKFGVFVNPIFHVMSDDEIVNKHIFVDYTIIKERSKYISKPNCHVNDNVLTALDPKIFSNLNTSVKDDEIAKNKIFTVNNIGTGDFISLSDFGVQWYDTNDFINLNEVKDKLPETLFNGLLEKGTEGYDIIPVYRLSNVLNREQKLNESIISNDNVYISDFESPAKYKINDDILSKNDIKNKYSIYSKLFYRKNNFLDRSKALTELDLTYYNQLKLMHPDKSYNWYSIKVNDMIDSYSGYLKNATSYQYNPILATSSGMNFAFNVFTESSKSISGKFYGSIINEDELKLDNNFIWVDPYNLNKIISHYNETWLKNNDDKLKLYNNFTENSTTIKSFMCKFLNKLHLKFYGRLINGDINGNTNDNSILNNVYIRRRFFTNDLSVQDGYVPLVNVFWKSIQLSEIYESLEYDEERKVFYFNNLNYDPKYVHYTKDVGLWYFNDNKSQKFPCDIVDMSIFGDPEDYAVTEEIDGVTKKRYDCTKFVFELVFFKNMIRVDNNIWRLINLEEKYAAPYKDLYLYEIENDQEFNPYIEIKELVNVKNGCNMHSPATGCYPKNSGNNRLRGVLKPMFNLVTIQNKEETVVFTEYSVNNINKCYCNNDIYYRHNMNNVVAMYDLSTINKNIPVTIKGDNYLYKDYFDKYVLSNVNKYDYENDQDYSKAIDNFIKENKLKVFDKTYDLFGLNELKFRNYSFESTVNEELVYHTTYEDVERTVIYNENEFKTTYSTIYNKLSTYTTEGEWEYDDKSIHVTKRIVPPFDIHYIVNSYLKVETLKEEYIKHDSYTYYDEMNLFNDWNICTYSYNNEMYGFYVIDVDLNNSINSFDVETEDGEYLKYISYINDTNITTNPRIINEVYKQAIPFIKNNPLNFMIKNSYTMVKPKLINLPCYYHPVDKVSYYDIVLDKMNYEKLTLERYFDNITPLIQPASSLITYNMKYKDVKTSFNSRYFTNETIYPQLTSLVEYLGVRIYDMYSLNVYENKKDIEWKHFNDNKVYNLEESFSYTFDNVLTKKELILWQTDSKIYEIFKDHLLEYDHSLLDEDKIKWAYTKYQVKHASEPVEIDNDGNKLYNLELYFTLY